MEKKLKCVICESEVRSEEHETGSVSCCDCQNDLSADFNPERWVEASEKDEKIIGETEKTVDKILRTMDLDKSGVETELRNTIKKSRDMFDIVDEYSYLFMQKDLRPMDFYYLAQDQLTGVYCYIKTISDSMKAIVDKQHVRRYYFKKIECEKNNEKFVATSTEKECDFFVSDMKIFLSVFEGYLESAKQGIQTCRRRISSTETEQDFSK